MLIVYGQTDKTVVFQFFIMGVSLMKIVYVTFSIFVLLVLTTVVYGADESLVLALAFDEGQGTTTKDSSQYGFKAAIEGPVWADGKFGKALKFDGVDDIVRIADATQLRLLKGGTMMAWSYLLEGGHATFPRLIHKSDITAGTGGYEILFDRAVGNAVRFCIGGACESYPDMQLKNGAWYHVAVTFDGKTMKAYVNGSLVGEKAQPGAAIDTPNIALIIGNSFNAQRQYQGTIDEVRMWSRVLSASEIKAQTELGIQGVISSVDPNSKLATTWANMKR
jgi:hypothetical protein